MPGLAPGSGVLAPDAIRARVLKCPVSGNTRKDREPKDRRQHDRRHARAHDRTNAAGRRDIGALDESAGGAAATRSPPLRGSATITGTSKVTSPAKAAPTESITTTMAQPSAALSACLQSKTMCNLDDEEQGSSAPLPSSSDQRVHPCQHEHGAQHHDE